MLQHKSYVRFTQHLFYQNTQKNHTKRNTCIVIAVNIRLTYVKMHSEDLKVLNTNAG